MSLGGLVLRALIAGLVIAALAAITALLGGDWSDTHWRVVGTSLGFSLFTALGASGDALRRKAHGWRMAFGALTTGIAILAFALLLAAIWIDSESESMWTAWGIAGLTSLWGSHASLVLAAQQPGDRRLVKALTWTSIVAATFDTLVGNLAVAGVGDPGDAFLRFLGVVIVITVLTTALPPIIRRLAPRSTDAFGREPELADALTAIARRLEQEPVDARREAAALRELAERARG
jgi:hypothetical protein